MVHTHGNKLIIEMDVITPVENLQSLQREIISAIQCYNYNDFGNVDGCPFLGMLQLLEATLPTFQQQRQILEFTEMANDPEISETDIAGWVASKRKYLLNEIQNQ